MIDINGCLAKILQDSHVQQNSYWTSKLLQHSFGKAHLAIMCEPYLSMVLEGTKTIESRFSKKRIVPFQKVDTGDVIIFKKSGGFILGIASIDEVIYKEPQNREELLCIKATYNNRICASDAFWEDKADSKYATLMGLAHLLKVSPISISQKNRQAWIVGDSSNIYTPIVCISGEIASGKTFLSKQLSRCLGCTSYSVSDYLKSIAAEYGNNNPSRSDLQSLGQLQISKGWESFVDSFLSFVHWNPSEPLIVDGIRHLDFYTILKQRMNQVDNTRVVSMFIYADELTRLQRLQERGEFNLDADHVSEGNLKDIQEAYDVTLDNIHNGMGIIQQAIDVLSDVIYGGAY